MTKWNFYLIKPTDTILIKDEIIPKSTKKYIIRFTLENILFLSNSLLLSKRKYEYTGNANASAI